MCESGSGTFRGHCLIKESVGGEMATEFDTEMMRKNRVS